MENINRWGIEIIDDMIPHLSKNLIDYQRRDTLLRLTNDHGVGGERITKQLNYDRLQNDIDMSLEALSEEEIADNKKEGMKKFEPIEIENLINTVTQGKYLDLRNLNHAIGGGQPWNKPFTVDDSHKNIIEKTPIARGTLIGDSFDLKSSIKEGENNNFHVVTGPNAWAGHGKPIAILSPGNQHARLFFRDAFEPRAIFPLHGTSEYRTLQEYLKSIRKFNEEGDLVGFKVKENISRGGYVNRLLFLCGQPIITFDRIEGFKNTFSNDYLDKVNKGAVSAYSWADIADTIVDLPAGKLYTRKYTESEQKEAEEDMRQYKEELRKMLEE